MRITFLMACSMLIALPSSLQAACWSRGNPAFRGPDGKCVGWAALDRICGRPPTTRCAYEGGGAGNTGQENGTSLSQWSAAWPGAAAFHVRTVKLDEIACTSQAVTARVVRSCATQTDAVNCKAQMDDVLNSGECVKLPEPRSKLGRTHSTGSGFDPGAPSALWSERKLILD